MRSMTIQFDSVVKGGLPVTVVASIYGPERDVGIFSHWAEIDNLLWQSTGKPITKYVFDSIPESDIDRLIDEACQMASKREYNI